MTDPMKRQTKFDFEPRQPWDFDNVRDETVLTLAQIKHAVSLLKAASVKPAKQVWAVHPDSVDIIEDWLKGDVIDILKKSEKIYPNN